MNILIVEDEELAQRKLQKTLALVDPSAQVVGITDSIETTVQWLQSNGTADLILMDIELADGQSFEIFNQVEVKAPVIFTTSYDEYALKAFKVNSVDYLLKPVQTEDLDAALTKYKKLTAGSRKDVHLESLVKQIQQQLQPKEYRKRFLVKHAQKLVSISTLR